MVNTTKGGDEGTPEVNKGRRDFLKKSLTGGAAIAAMSVLGTGLTGCRKVKNPPVKGIAGMKEVSDIGLNDDFKLNMAIASVKLVQAYNWFEFNVAKNYYRNTPMNVDMKELTDLSMALRGIEGFVINSDVREEINNRLIKLDGNDIDKVYNFFKDNPDLFAKKYPTLAPIIEEWKKKNGK